MHMHYIDIFKFMVKLEKHPSRWEIMKAKNTISKLINLTFHKITMSYSKIVVFTFLWQKLPHITFIV
jgi:hypothetical protein